MAEQPGGQFSVTPEKALHFFDLPRSANVRDLNLAYRRMVRKYHPDYNPERARWAHEVMIKVNGAYDVALEYLAALRYEEVERQLDLQVDAHHRFTDIFDAIANSVLEGIFIYYQYGLENPFTREHGVPRFRYRLAIKKVATGVSQLERLEPPNEVDFETLSVFNSFSLTFLQCMKISKSNDPSAHKNEQLAYRHYHAGSELLDRAIRKLLFGGELAPSSALDAPHAMSVAHAEFMKVLAEYAETSWVTDAAIKSYLLDCLQQLERVSRRIPSLCTTD